MCTTSSGTTSRTRPIRCQSGWIVADSRLSTARISVAREAISRTRPRLRCSSIADAPVRAR